MEESIMGETCEKGVMVPVIRQNRLVEKTGKWDIILVMYFVPYIRGWLTALLLAGAVLTGKAYANDASTNAPSSGETSRRRPLVVLKQATIKGRIFIIVDENSTRPARKSKIEILDKEGDRKIHETVVDEEGGFTLPNMETGQYMLKAGRLYLELVVQSPEGPESTVKRIPKTILIFTLSELVE
jgi:hypothetical protein